MITTDIVQEILDLGVSTVIL